ncbi:hypothetical protein HMPREF1548_04401 [Clostridium sp. KLE 1755]|nr:hypothetical protein HMPREF1548_04401 [Clostridium sp. KLE 1755]
MKEDYFQTKRKKFRFLEKRGNLNIFSFLFTGYIMSTVKAVR